MNTNVNLEIRDKNGQYASTLVDYSKPERFSSLPDTKRMDQQNCSGYSAMHLAIQKRNHNLIFLLCQNGAEVNIPGPDGATPLHIAAALGDNQTIRILTKYGAYVNSIQSMITAILLFIMLLERAMKKL